MSPPLRVYGLRLRNGWKFMLLVATLSTGLAALCQRNDWLWMSAAERVLYDQGLTTFAGQRPRSRDVVIVGIDDMTLQGIRDNDRYVRNYGVYPYSRNLWARVIDILAAAGARAVVFDMVMDERGSDEGTDLDLQQAIEAGAVPVALGFNIIPGRPSLPPVKPVNRLPLPAAPPPQAPPPAEGVPLL
ncbi:MAG TPA: CHASE2 domain-containing protein, partial [Archangium sp.]|nr:CHASE2 domain-containing protein [Archangium sp.]